MNFNNLQCDEFFWATVVSTINNYLVNDQTMASITTVYFDLNIFSLLRLRHLPLSPQLAQTKKVVKAISSTLVSK